ncbi:hypothetical protein EYF80_022803 [Liparis tanakae]|uniref:Uncharacterized protein n=1 Tax=Liparis tanakae TaxID=230148 RepID=A0A4Z2HN63_9TELE|nr:hypothetical protein EYF80_022803 [Liparis tanakae]
MALGKLGAARWGPECVRLQRGARGAPCRPRLSICQPRSSVRWQNKKSCFCFLAVKHFEDSKLRRRKRCGQGQVKGAQPRLESFVTWSRTGAGFFSRGQGEGRRGSNATSDTGSRAERPPDHADGRRVTVEKTVCVAAWEDRNFLGIVGRST